MSVPPPKRTVTRHLHFYYANGSIIFRVEDTLYKLARDTLEKDSELFRDMFSLDAHCVGPPRTEGTIDEDPIILPLTVEQFDLYLEVSTGQ